MAKRIWATEGEAVNFVDWTSWLFFYTWADWDDSSDSSRRSQVNSIQHFGGFWHDDEIIYLVSIPQLEIVDKFDQKKCSEYTPDELYEAILTYVTYYGDISGF
ncbi:MAG: hypothetical protein FJ042_02695 [Candidatus Cloacimonetes bacterium]|nr:hypothetical protein [Candidatus Cloacimonadota bacterium]